MNHKRDIKKYLIFHGSWWLTYLVKLGFLNISRHKPQIFPHWTWHRTHFSSKMQSYNFFLGIFLAECERNCWANLTRLAPQLWQLWQFHEFWWIPTTTLYITCAWHGKKGGCIFRNAYLCSHFLSRKSAENSLIEQTSSQETPYNIKPKVAYLCRKEKIVK